MWGLSQLARMALAAGAGWLLAVSAGVTLLPRSPAYLIAATALLVVGLYSSTTSIDLRELRSNIRTVVLAVTVGVVIKAAIIAGVMYLLFHESRYAILGLAVAQIDPLAVAAMHNRTPMSARARSLLAAWAAFDDPITVLLTVYGAAWALHRQADGPAGLSAATGSVGLSLVANAALVCLAFVMVVALRRLRRPDGTGRRVRTPLTTCVEVSVLLLLGAAAVGLSLALAIAVIGLFFRPPIDRAVTRATAVAFFAATFLLGLALSDGVSVGPGIALGVAAFGAQIVVGALVPTRLPPRDRLQLAFGQQNGITAIILALLLEPQFPGTIGTVAPAIAVVAILHAVTNGAIEAAAGRGRTTLTALPAVAAPGAGSRPLPTDSGRRVC